MQDAVVTLSGITKYFHTLCANNSIDFDLQKGEVHAILGENGAGKSTLMNILYGMLRPDLGKIHIRGKQVDISSPRIAIQHGIGMVHQHFMLVEPFTVAENIILGAEITNFGILDRKGISRHVEKLSKKYGLNIDPECPVRELSIGVQQRVELLKALYRGAEILILDEPTAVLTPQEIEELTLAIKGLTKEGKSVILITHKLREIMQAADRCTVIRKGKRIDTVHVADIKEHDLARMMVGHAKPVAPIPRKKGKGNPCLVLDNVSVNSQRGLPALKGVDLQLREGEILALAGVEGNGQRELLEVLSGTRALSGGSVYFRGNKLEMLNPRKMFQAGLGNIPEDRHKEGLILEFDVGKNLILHSYQDFSSGMWLNKEKIYASATDIIKKFSIFPEDCYYKCADMSGGNQQKVVIARELSANPLALIVAHPTRGLDIGAAYYVHKCLCEQRDKGVAVLLISFDLDEIFYLSDRIAVMYEGRIIGMQDTKATTTHEIGLLLAGGKV